MKQRRRQAQQAEPAQSKSWPRGAVRLVVEALVEAKLVEVAFVAERLVVVADEADRSVVVD